MSTPELKPMPRRRLTEPERWAVYLDGRRIGEIHEKRLGRGNVFYQAFAVDPTTGELVDLALNTDRDERLAAIVAYVGGPGSWEAYRQAQADARFMNPFPSQGGHSSPNISGLGGWSPGHDESAPPPTREGE